MGSLDRATRSWSSRHLEASIASEEDPAILRTLNFDDAANLALKSLDEKRPAEATTVQPAKRRRKSVESTALAALRNSVCSVLFRTVQNFEMDLVMDEGSM